MDTVTLISIASFIGSIIASVIGALVLRNQSLQDNRWQELRELIRLQDTRIEDHGREIKEVKVAAANCKISCTQTFTTNEAFVREAGFMRRTIEAHTQVLAEIKGTLQVVNRIPEVAGQIAANIVREMKSTSKEER